MVSKGYSTKCVWKCFNCIDGPMAFSWICIIIFEISLVTCVSAMIVMQPVTFHFENDYYFLTITHAKWREGRWMCIIDVVCCVLSSFKVMLENNNNDDNYDDEDTNSNNTTSNNNDNSKTILIMIIIIIIIIMIIYNHMVAPLNANSAMLRKTDGYNEWKHESATILNAT